MSGQARRLWLAGAVAGAAGLGLGLQRWRATGDSSRGDVPDPGAQALDSMWSLTFDQPGGGKLAMQSLRGRPLVINFWATWCPPCVKELPELQRFHQAFAPSGWQVLALAIDREEAVREFLAKTPLKLTVALGGMDGIDLGRMLGNDRGGLPFTAVFDGQGRIARRKAGQTHFDELQGWARTITGPGS